MGLGDGEVRSGRFILHCDKLAEEMRDMEPERFSLGSFNGKLRFWGGAPYASADAFRYLSLVWSV